MAYADIIRTPQPKIEDIASLIEGVFGSSSPLTIQTWTPTFTCSGSMTISGTPTIYNAFYFEIGDLVFFLLAAQVTTAGSASTTIYFTLPVTSDGNPTPFFTGGLDSGVAGSSNLYDSTKGLVEKYDRSNWTIGANRIVYAGGVFRKP